MKNISEILDNLNLKDINEGTSNGVNHLKSDGELKNVFSPVDGKKLHQLLKHQVIVMRKSLLQLKIHFQNGEMYLHLPGEKLLDK